MDMKASLEQDVRLARTHLQNARTKEETIARSLWLGRCKQRLEDFKNDEGEFRKNQ